MYPSLFISFHRFFFLKKKKGQKRGRKGIDTKVSQKGKDTRKLGIPYTFYPLSIPSFSLSKQQ